MMEMTSPGCRTWTDLMILCRHHEHWYIAVRSNPESKGCALRAGIRMPSDPGFVQQTDWLKSKSMPSVEGIQFFPELFYHGHRVYPEHWSPESSEPLLMCFTGSDAWRRSPRTTAQLNEMIEEFKRERWSYNPADQEARKYIHVDELEKIEGPLPRAG